MNNIYRAKYFNFEIDLILPFPIENQEPKLSRVMQMDYLLIFSVCVEMNANGEKNLKVVQKKNNHWWE